MRRRVLGWIVPIALALVGCTEYTVGAPSFTLISNAGVSDHYEPIGPVRERSACSATYFLLFGGGEQASHEAALAALLAEADADVLLNAELTTDRVQLILFTVTCAKVRGQPARVAVRSS